MRPLWIGLSWIVITLVVLQLRGPLEPRPPADASPTAVLVAFLRATALGDCRLASEYTGDRDSSAPRLGCPGGGRLVEYELVDDGAEITNPADSYYLYYVRMRLDGLGAPFDGQAGFFVHVDEVSPGEWRVRSMGTGP